MIDPEAMFHLNPQERRELIEEQAAKVDIGEHIPDKLGSAFRISSTINTFIVGYFDLRIQDCGEILVVPNLRNAIKSEISNFLPEVINEMNASIPSDKSLEKSLKNIYELSGAKRLAFSNKITRTLSTKMGSLWERIANISPYAINPELEFNGLKITGIDSLVWNKDEEIVEYHQIKTQENTLTGSQKPRSIEELLIHEHPVFSTCFKTKASWTFAGHERIPRLSGEQFWARIGIDYSLLVECIRDMIQELEAIYVELLQDEDKWTDSQGEIFGDDNV